MLPLGENASYTKNLFHCELAPRGVFSYSWNVILEYLFGLGKGFGITSVVRRMVNGWTYRKGEQGRPPLDIELMLRINTTRPATFVSWRDEASIKLQSLPLMSVAYFVRTI